MILWTSVTSVIGIAALAGGVDAWFLRRATGFERILLITGDSCWFITPGYLMPSDWA